MREFRKACARLKAAKPTRYPVRIYVVPGLEDLGDCVLRSNGRRKKWFSIRVRKERQDVMWHTLLEEYAHALAWYVRSTKSDHHQRWSKTYSDLRIWWESLDG